MSSRYARQVFKVRPGSILSISREIVRDHYKDRKSNGWTRTAGHSRFRKQSYVYVPHVTEFISNQPCDLG